jgi:beta-N-acetylhexosaminidase
VRRPSRGAGARAALASLASILVAGLVLGGCAGRIAPERAAALSADLGQLLLVGFHGTTADDNPSLERLLCQARVGGVLIFARNVVDGAQLARLTGAARERARACTGQPLLVAADAEGGAVMRLHPRGGWTATMSAQELGRANDVALTELEARRIGGMLREAGVNWNLAPVVDVGYNPANPVIVGTGRSFSADPRLVTEHARAFVRGMREAGLLTALKHFPGHGSSFADSHLGFVDVTDTARPEVELQPYRALIADGLADSVMTAHVVNRWLDPFYPATLSARAVEGVLRLDLGFEGPVVSDDLRMGAIEQHYGMAEAALLALQAGVDVLLIADDRLPDGGSASGLVLQSLRQALADGRLPVSRVTEALARISALRSRLPR